MNDVELWCGDCLELMKGITNGSIDMILADLPYGTTDCRWDVIIPFELLWKEYERIGKENAAIVLFGSEPFTSLIVLSRIELFRYSLVWEKEQATNFMFLKKQFGKIHEDIVIFYKKQPFYNPQMSEGHTPSNTGNPNIVLSHNGINGGTPKREGSTDRYPTSILRFNRDRSKLHPTQKPVALLEYLIRTFTLENEIVLDNTMGSGSTGVACKKSHRKFIGIEKDEKYFQIAKERICG